MPHYLDPLEFSSAFLVEASVAVVAEAEAPLGGGYEKTPGSRGDLATRGIRVSDGT